MWENQEIWDRKLGSRDVTLKAQGPWARDPNSDNLLLCMLFRRKWPWLSSDFSSISKILKTFKMWKRDVFVCQGCHNKILQTRGLTNRNVLSHGSGGWKSRNEVEFLLKCLSVACRWSPLHCVLTCTGVASLCTGICLCGPKFPFLVRTHIWLY